LEFVQVRFRPLFNTPAFPHLPQCQVQSFYCCLCFTIKVGRK
jgi:hypothetical protein